MGVKHNKNEKFPTFSKEFLKCLPKPVFEGVRH